MKDETRREKIEIQELRRNLWRWRENGGWETRSGKEKQNAPSEKSNEKKLKFLEYIIEREKNEKDRCQKLGEKEKSRQTQEDEKKKIRLELKMTLTLKWQTVR